eukprot:m.159818 g.159818  ORF g.159818 m.159818 type:complete len:387 (-) comp15159_c0_seq6:1533-2693(-)
MQDHFLTRMSSRYKLGAVVCICPSSSEISLATLRDELIHSERAENDTSYRWMMDKTAEPWRIAQGNDTELEFPNGVTLALIATGVFQDESVVNDHLLPKLKASPLVHDVEVWITAPCPIPIVQLKSGSISYNLIEDTKADGTVGLGWDETFADLGMVIFAGCIEKTQLKQIQDAVDIKINQVEQSITKLHKDLKIGETEFAFKEICSRGNHRFDLLLPKDFSCLVGADSVWLGAVATLMKIPKEEISCQVSVVYSRPGAPQQEWHTDGGHLDLDAGWPDENRQVSKPYAICVFVPLINTNPEVGYTQFWPGSHKYKGLLGFGPAATLLDACYDGACEAGDAILYDYRLMHRGMDNTSLSTTRPILQFLYHASWYQETKNYGKDSVL